MASLEHLQQQIATLEAQIEALQQEGDFLIGVRLERSPAGGTASQEAKSGCRYARLRSGRGKLLPNGKRSLYIAIHEIAHYEAACKRGAEIQALQRKLRHLQKQRLAIEQSYYRSLKGKPAPRPRQSRLLSIDPVNETAVILDPPSVPSAPAAILVLYRQHPDAPVHAVAAEVWQGAQKIAEVNAVHCMGMRGDRVSAYLKELLSSLTQQYGVWKFEDVIKEMPVLECPLIPCPLKHQPALQPEQPCS